MATTLKEIANRAGVSVMAVSAVMNKTTSTRVSERKRAVIEQIAREMGYRSNVVASTLRGGESRMIGILIDSCAPPWLYNILRHIESEATAGGYRILISEGHDSVDNLAAAYEKFEQYGVDGVICLAYDYPGQQEKFREHFGDKNNILLVGSYDESMLPQIYLDLEPAWLEAVRYFRSHGRKRIGGIIADLPIWCQQVRISLFRKICRDLKIPELLWHQNYCAEPERYAGEADRCVCEFIRPNGLDAVLAHSDVFGAFLISGLARNGLRVPEDVAVIVDDSRDFFAALQPPLACIDHDEKAIGTQAVRVMLKMLRKEPVDHRTLIPCHLILRESAG